MKNRTSLLLLTQTALNLKENVQNVLFEELYIFHAWIIVYDEKYMLHTVT